jgi:hypothetical protein
MIAYPFLAAPPTPDTLLSLADEAAGPVLGLFCCEPSDAARKAHITRLQLCAVLATAFQKVKHA